MPHDYKHRAKSKPAPEKAAGWVWFMVGLLVGAFLMGLAWLKLGTPETEKRWISSTPDKPPQTSNKPPTTPTKQAGEKKQEPPKQTSNEKNATNKPQAEKSPPQFEFFEKLPKQEVAVSDKPLELRETHKEKPQNKTYYLQIASFNNRRDAEKVRAELGFLGIETTIKAVKIKAAEHYRVTAGPFVGLKALQTTQKQLSVQGYKKLLVIEKKQP